MENNNWLNLIIEEAIEPELEICDPHHHLWDYPSNTYMTNDLLADLKSGHNIKSTAYMECGSMYRKHGAISMRPIGETEFAHNIATSAADNRDSDIRICESIVGFADLTEFSVPQILDNHQEISKHFVGIRHASAWDSNTTIKNAHTNPIKELFSDSNFRRGFAELGKRNLTFDAWLYHPQIPELTALAKAFPDQIIILDHLGGLLGIGPYSGKRREIFNYWKKAISNLADCPNVFAKLGGLVMPINGFGFHKNKFPPTSQELAETTRNYYLFMIDTFGPYRCMFESNFPVDKASCSYTVLWNSFKLITTGFSNAEKSALYRQTAEKIYRID